MTPRKKNSTAPEAQKVEGVDIAASDGRKVLVWRATRPLTMQEHENLSAKLRFEAEKTGLAIVLVPFSVEAGVSDDG